MRSACLPSLCRSGCAAVVGLGCRGSSLLNTLAAIPQARGVAVCDRYPDRTASAAAAIKARGGGAPREYGDFRRVLDDASVQAVLIATSWEEHARMAAEAMRAHKITAMEVGGACGLAECREPVAAYEETKTPFFFLENCCYGKFELLSQALARAGELGTLVHAHGAYGHDLREEVLGGTVNRHYRLQHYLTRNCENYPTHELGPIAKILDINRGNRMVSLVSVASKAAGLEEFSYTDKNSDKSLRGQKFRQGDIVDTVITCANGETISLRLDTTLPRYYSREFTLRGTKGMCCQEANMILLGGAAPLHEFFDPAHTLRKYMDNAEDYADFLPDGWKNVTPQKLQAEHGGMDYFMLKDFFDAVLSDRPFPLDVYDAAAWMSVTALSERSVAEGGAPVAVPDFTDGQWRCRPRPDVLI